MSAFRTTLVDKAFERLDLDHSGSVGIADIKGLFNPSKHPAVLDGRKTDDQVLQDFLETFELHHSLKSGLTKDYRVGREEFREYYAHVSACIDSDEYFETVMNNSWNLSGQAAPAAKSQKSWAVPAAAVDPVRPTQSTRRAAFESPDSPFTVDNRQGPVSEQEEVKSVSRSAAGTEDRKQSMTKGGFGNTVKNDLPRCESIMLERFRGKLMDRGGKGVIGLERQFRIFDLDGSGELNREEFKRAVNDFKLGMDERDLDNLFKTFDKNKDGKISYVEFMQTLVGTMSEFRLTLVHNAFERLDAAGTGAVELEAIKHAYNAKPHPDVKCGKKTEEEVLSDFASTLDIHHSNWGATDGKVTKEEFVDYYTKISAAVESDSYFDIMMTKGWELGLDSNSDHQPYAGVATKIYQVDSKTVWNYDNHKTFFRAKHPEVDELQSDPHIGEGSHPKSIYELSEVAQPGYSGKKDRHESSASAVPEPKKG